MNAVYVRWVDSCNLFGDRWASRDDLTEAQQEHHCHTLGFVVDENSHSLYVAGSLAPEEIGSVMQIPKVAVVERRDLGGVDDLHGGGSCSRPGCPTGNTFPFPVQGVCP